MAHTPYAPSTNLRVLQNVPLEPDYINTLWFQTLAAQTTYFQSKTKYNLTNQSFQRVNNGVIRIQKKIEDLYDCNYIMFQNINFGTKWFYAFINSVEYVNNITSDIYYEIDVMQTWLKDFAVKPCFVEREHSATDEIGDNIVPETINTGEMVYNKVVDQNNAIERMFPELDQLVAVVATLGNDPTDPTAPVAGEIYDGIFSGLHYRAFLLEDSGGTAVLNIDTYINQWSQHPDDVICIFITTMAAFTDDVESHGRPTTAGVDIQWQSAAQVRIYTGHQIHANHTLDGHTVRNKKLFTFPFNYIHVDNANGKELNLRYEFFKDSYGNIGIPEFYLVTNISMPVTAVLRPKNYKGSKSDAPYGSDGDNMDTSESIDLTGYPVCSFAVDTWKAWVAQNSVPEAISAIGNALKFGLGAAAVGTGFGAGLAVTGVSMATDIVSKIYKASIQADICKGSYNSSNVNVARHMHNFFISRVSVCKQMAEIIDDYFDRYGYATNRVKVPYLYSRPVWNYVKTIGSNVDGNIPGNDKRIIDANFDKGITFWHDPTKVDDYSQSNAPVSP